MSTLRETVSLLSTNDTIWQVQLDLPCSPVSDQGFNVPCLYTTDTGAADPAVPNGIKLPSSWGIDSICCWQKWRVDYEATIINTLGFQPCLLHSPSAKGSAPFTWA